MPLKKTYRYFIAWLLAILLFTETFYGFFVVADYYTNTQAYAADCINKDKPQMHCNGQCQVQKKMNEAGNKDKQSNERKSETGFNILSSKSFFASVELLLSGFIKQQYFIFNPGNPVDNSARFFHPPQNFFHVTIAAIFNISQTIF